MVGAPPDSTSRMFCQLLARCWRSWGGPGECGQAIPKSTVFSAYFDGVEPFLAGGQWRPVAASLQLQIFQHTALTN